MHIGLGAYKNVGVVILRLNDVELGLVLVVIVLNVGIGNGDLGGNLFVKQFVDDQVPANPQLIVVLGHSFFFQPLGKVIFGGRNLDLIHAAFNFFIGGHDAELLGFLQVEVEGNDLMQELQAHRLFLFCGQLLRRAGNLLFEALVDFRTEDFVPVDLGHDVATGAVAVATIAAGQGQCQACSG